MVTRDDSSLGGIILGKLLILLLHALVLVQDISFPAMVSKSFTDHYGVPYLRELVISRWILER
jgi:hypothetical protein